MNKYIEEMKKFENSILFKYYYELFINYLKTSNCSYKSKELENVIGISGVEIRKLAQHARRNGILICSSDKGYKYALTKNEANETIKHLRQRMESLKHTIDAMENSKYYYKLK